MKIVRQVKKSKAKTTNESRRIFFFPKENTKAELPCYFTFNSPLKRWFCCCFAVQIFTIWYLVCLSKISFWTRVLAELVLISSPQIRPN